MNGFFEPSGFTHRAGLMWCATHVTNKRFGRVRKIGRRRREEAACVCVWRTLRSS
jgi:hypothetical protein